MATAGALRRRVQRIQTYINKTTATSMAHTQQIRLTMVPSIAIPVCGAEEELPATLEGGSGAADVVQTQKERHHEDPCHRLVGSPRG